MSVISVKLKLAYAL